jgi:hypothetical protein
MPSPCVSFTAIASIMMLLQLSTRSVLAFTNPAATSIRTGIRSRAFPHFSTTSDDTSTEKTAAEKEATAPTFTLPVPLDVNYSMEEIVSLCKRRGIIFPSSEIYNGYAGFYDYGPLGAELKKNVKDAWWRTFCTSREDVVGLDSSIVHNPATWKSSGT